MKDEVAHLRPTSSEGISRASTVYGAYVVTSKYSQLKRAAVRLSQSRQLLTWSTEAIKRTAGHLDSSLSMSCVSLLLSPA